MTGAGAVLLAAAVLVFPAPATVRRAAGTGFAAGTGPLRSLVFRQLSRTSARCGSLWFLACVPLIFIGPGVGGATLAVLFTARKVIIDRADERRVSRARAALLDGLDAVVAELGAGAHPVAAAEAAISECEGDAATAFAACAGHGRLGGNAAAGLRSPDSVIAVELDRLAGVWELAEHHGLALADLLAAVRKDIAGRLRFREHTNATIAGTRASALVLAGLPILGVVLGESMGAQPLRLLLGRGFGQVLLVMGVGLVCAGLCWTEAMIRQVLR